MEKFKLLIIGDANHQYITIFVKWLRKVFPNISISIISTNINIDLIALKNIYEEVYIIPDNNKFISNIKGIRTIAKGWEIYRLILEQKLNPNTILVHYATPYLAFFGSFLRRKTKNYIISLWGSDFYRATPKFYLDLNLKNADKIIISSPQMIKDFNSQYSKYIKKVHLCYFGNEVIKYIDNIKSKEESFYHLNLNKNKLNVTIGYNGSKAHQHIQVINTLSKLDEKISERIRLLFPLTYSLNDEYLIEIKKACNNLNIEQIYFTEFMSEIDIAHLRKATDIMINVQITDAFNGSMKEVLYCGGIVINGSWLPYQFLKEADIYFEEVDSVEQISDKLEKIIMNYSYYQEQCKNNAVKIYEFSNWSKVIHQWEEVIKQQR